MPNMLVTRADADVTEAHRHDLLAEAAGRRLAEAARDARDDESDRKPERSWHPRAAHPAGARTMPETDPLLAPERQPARLHLRVARAWLAWVRTYVLLWVVGVVLCGFLAAGALVAGEFWLWGW